jgi:hypothetical protein
MSAVPQARVFLNDPVPIKRLRLDWTSAQTDAFLDNMDIYRCRRLGDMKILPKEGIMFAEDEQTKKAWEAKWVAAKKADKRIPSRPSKSLIGKISWSSLAARM